MPNAPVIEVDGLTKTFRAGMSRHPVTAVQDVSLRIERGSVVAFVGPNGAGKTTTIYALLGLVRPDRGRIRVLGHDAGSLEARRRTGVQTEIFHTYAFKTAEQTLHFYGRLSEVPPADLAQAVPRQLGRLGLAAAAKRRVRGFSKGMVQRLGLAQALLHQPELLILDEPTTGLDPEGRKLVADIIEEEKARGTTIFLSSHILSDVERVADQVVILRRGKVVLAASMAQLGRDSRTWEIEVLRWSDGAREAVQGAEVVERPTGGSWVRCDDGERSAFLLRLLQAGAEVGAVRRGRSLEDIYMHYAGGTSDG